MTTEIGALRRAFEAYINPDADVNLHWLAAGYYAGRGVQQSWLDFQAGHAAAKAEPAAAVAAERDYWRNELHALLEAADAVATNNAHAVSIGSVRYAKHSQTWKAYASLDRARQRASDAIRAGAKETGNG